jgi:hypothetical protein
MALKLVHIGHLYPAEMNIYGDNGNVMALTWRLKRYGFQIKLHRIGVGTKLPTQLDILITGGGQDSGQLKIHADLLKKADELKAQVTDGLSLLAVCGTYQLFGHYFATNSNQRLVGIGIFDAYTEAKDKRLIGNIVINSPFGRLVGFENHSGQTVLAEDQLPLGRVTKGFGNNDASGKEGAVSFNAIGTYLHGPLLPKNPNLSDHLIKQALDRRFGSSGLPELDDSLALKAADIAAMRP